MLKQTIILLTMLTFSTLSFGQIKANLTVDFVEGDNTVILDGIDFQVKATEGIVTSISTGGEELTEFGQQIATLYSRIEGFANEIDIKNSDAIWENAKFLVVIKLIPKEEGYNAQCYLFEK
jgi:hypothetical protein